MAKVLTCGLSNRTHPHIAPVAERGCVGDQPQQVRSSSGVVYSKAFVQKRLLRLTFQAQSRSGGSARMRAFQSLIVEKKYPLFRAAVSANSNRGISPIKVKENPTALPEVADSNISQLWEFFERSGIHRYRIRSRRRHTRGFHCSESRNGSSRR